MCRSSLPPLESSTSPSSFAEISSGSAPVSSYIDGWVWSTVEIFDICPLLGGCPLLRGITTAMEKGVFLGGSSIGGSTVAILSSVERLFSSRR